MKTKEIKLFIRFLKDENFYFKYKKFFFDEKIGVDYRKFYFKSVYNEVGTISTFLTFVNKYEVFDAFWWVTTNHAYGSEIYNLREKWLKYYEKIIQWY